MVLSFQTNKLASFSDFLSPSLPHSVFLKMTKQIGHAVSSHTSVVPSEPGHPRQLWKPARGASESLQQQQQNLPPYRVYWIVAIMGSCRGSRELPLEKGLETTAMHAINTGTSMVFVKVTP